MGCINDNQNDARLDRDMIVEWDMNTTISAEMVERAISKLKGKKAPGIDGICEEHLFYAPGCVTAHLATLFTTMLRHGYIPDLLTTGVIVPLIKDKLGDSSDMSNYRGITLSSSISKVLEYVIAEVCEDCLVTPDLQFGFKKEHSTTCSFVVQETIEYFNTRGSPVFGCFMDASKAFDLVNHDLLFSILEERGFNPAVLRLLENWYRKLTTRVRWGQKFSDEFQVTNGIRQGGVLSPVLFSIYIDELLKRLSISAVLVNVTWELLHTRMISV